MVRDRSYAQGEQHPGVPPETARWDGSRRGRTCAVISSRVSDRMTTLRRVDAPFRDSSRELGGCVPYPGELGRSGQL